MSKEQAECIKIRYHQKRFQYKDRKYKKISKYNSEFEKHYNWNEKCTADLH